MQSSAQGWGVFGLDLLASGGSGFWNSILDYNLKDLQKVEGSEGNELSELQRGSTIAREVVAHDQGWGWFHPLGDAIRFLAAELPAPIDPVGAGGD